jgi:transposase-like protein
MQNPFRYFNSSPEVIRLVVMMYTRYPLSLRQVEDLLHERGIDISHETVRSDVRRCDQETTHSLSVVFAMALAP